MARLPEGTRTTTDQLIAAARAYQEATRAADKAYGDFEAARFDNERGIEDDTGPVHGPDDMDFLEGEERRARAFVQFAKDDLVEAAFLLLEPETPEDDGGDAEADRRAADAIEQGAALWMRDD